ncbi:MAG: phosphatidylglycerophosphatase A, partial [Pseudomonadota bacterium]|nr:phosphatidylglycerophosphatase A [Pseudomonadota bacterium]
SKEMGTHDDPGMNIDEFVGYLVTMIAAPHSWIAVLLGFGYFRLFDIWKPWLIGWVDKHVHGGIGMILDDVIAGVAAAIALQLTWLAIF